MELPQELPLSSPYSGDHSCPEEQGSGPGCAPHHAALLPELAGSWSFAPAHCSGQSYSVPNPTHVRTRQCTDPSLRDTSRESPGVPPEKSPVLGRGTLTVLQWGPGNPCPAASGTLPPHGCIFSLPPCRYKDGKLIPKQSQSSMQIKDVSEQHAGTYTLVLRNRLAGLEKRISLQLIVNGKGVGQGWGRGEIAEPMAAPFGLL